MGSISPSKFIPVAERIGLINEVGEWVLHEVGRQTRAWQDQETIGLVISVNVSPIQFRRDDIEREVAKALDACGLDPKFLELKLTESLMVADIRSNKSGS